MFVTNLYRGEGLWLVTPDGKEIRIVMADVIGHDRVRLAVDAPPAVKIEKRVRRDGPAPQSGE